jgi:hypothetical protein
MSSPRCRPEAGAEERLLQGGAAGGAVALDVPDAPPAQIPEREGEQRLGGRRLGAVELHVLAFQGRAFQGTAIKVLSHECKTGKKVTPITAAGLLDMDPEEAARLLASLDAEGDYTDDDVPGLKEIVIRIGKTEEPPSLLGTLLLPDPPVTLRQAQAVGSYIVDKQWALAYPRYNPHTVDNLPELDARSERGASTASLAYEGTAPFIFASYSHEDSDTVIEDIIKLTDARYRVWLDEGIVPSSNWIQTIADHVARCTLFLVYDGPRQRGSHRPAVHYCGQSWRLP